MENTSDTFHVAQETQKLDRTEGNGHKTSYCYLEIVVMFWIFEIHGSLYPTSRSTKLRTVSWKCDNTNKCQMYHLCENVSSLFKNCSKGLKGPLLHGGLLCIGDPSCRQFTGDSTYN